MRSVCARLIMFISICSTGLFAGFAFYFLFVMAPSMAKLSRETFFEIHRIFHPIFRPRLAILYFTVWFSTLAWLLMSLRRWKSVAFYCLAGAFFCITDDLFLSYKGHYKVNEAVRQQMHGGSASWQELHKEWTQFMAAHTTVLTVAFILLLIAHFLFKKSSPLIRR